MSHDKVFITGGAGFIGKAIIERLYERNKIVIYSRDESKHYYLKKRYPNVKCVVGDISDYDSMVRAAHGCNRGIFAASMKQIEACDENPAQAAKTILTGALNSRNLTDELVMKSGTFISTDKSRAATTVYGSLKFAAGESFILNPREDSFTILNTAIYGNVLNSTGSIIPLIWQSIKAGRVLTLYSEEMTRFMITKSHAVDLLMAASVNYSGFNLIPELSSFKVKDLFDIYADEYGLSYKVGSPRVGEKIHEIMIAPEEISRTRLSTSSGFPIYLLSPSPNPKGVAGVSFVNNEYSSRDHTLSKEKLREFIASYGYFKS